MENKEGIEKGIILKQFRLTHSQLERLETLAKNSGFNTVSAYIRHRLFNDLPFDLKLNKILELIEKNEK
jgi:hypothetical protein